MVISLFWLSLCCFVKYYGMS